MITDPTPHTEKVNSQERLSTASFCLSPKNIAQVLGVVICVLAIASLAGQFAKYVLGYTALGGLIALFDVNGEQNVPTWYSSVQLLLCAIFLGAIAWAKKNDGECYARHWGVLAIIFLALSLDETASLHEMTIKPLRSLLRAGGVLRFTWVVPGAAFLLSFIAAYLRFFIRLPQKTRRLFGTAGSLYAGGALGLELISGYHASVHGQANMTFAILATIEEVCEMIGVLVFMYALMSYISTYVTEVKVDFSE